MIALLLILQLFQVLFLALHDWIQLGNLNDVESVRKANPVNTLIVMTLISTIPFGFGLVASIFYLGTALPGWLRTYLWVSYTLLFVGELTAWWLPYLFGEAPEFVERYETMFGHTHAFLPLRHGIRPNTLHVILHLATLSTLVVLGVITFRESDYRVLARNSEPAILDRRVLPRKQFDARWQLLVRIRTHSLDERRQAVGPGIHHPRAEP